MIHSMAGGVLGDQGVYTFAKVETEGVPMWYLAPMPVAAGQRVVVPAGRASRAVEGVVLRVETCTPHTAPVPVGRAKSILRVLPQGEPHA